MKPVYAREDDPPTFRAECDGCDWGESGPTFVEVRRWAKVHLRAMFDQTNDHDDAVVTIWRVQGWVVNE